MEVPALGSSQARLRAQADAARKALAEQQEQAPELVLARYAYVVAYVDGNVYLVSDLDHVEASQVTRAPSLDEMYGVLSYATHNADEIENPTPFLLGEAKYDWALLVAVTEDGRYLLYNTVDVPVSDERIATPTDVMMSAEVVLSDLLSSKTAMKAAQATVQGMMQIGAQMQGAMSEQQANEAALLEAKKKFGAKPVG